MTRRRFSGAFAALALGGALLAALSAGGLGRFQIATHVENAAAIPTRSVTPPQAAIATTAAAVGEAAAGDSNPPQAVGAIAAPVGEAAADDASSPKSIVAVAALIGASAAAAPAAEPVSTDPAPAPPPAPTMQLASIPPSAVDDGLKLRLESPARASEPSAPCGDD